MTEGSLIDYIAEAVAAGNPKRIAQLSAAVDFLEGRTNKSIDEWVEANDIKIEGVYTPRTGIWYPRLLFTHEGLYIDLFSCEARIHFSNRVKFVDRVGIREYAKRLCDQ